MLHKLAWSQLFNEKRRLMAALAGIGFAVMLQLAQFGFRDALFDSATVLHDSLAADLILTSTLYENEVATGSITRRRLYQALGVSGVESITPVNVGITAFKNPQTGRQSNIIVIGFDPDQVAMDIPAVIDNAQLLHEPDVALFDALSRPEFGPVVDIFNRHKTVTTEVAGRRVTIGGLFELGTSFAGNGHIIVSDATFRKVFHRLEGPIEFGLIRLKPGTDVAATQAELIGLYPNDVKVLTRDEMRALERAYWAAATPIGFIFLAGAIVGIMVGAVIVYQILYTDVSDHLAEYATLKAMGYADRYLFVIVLDEALILSFCGFPIGYALAEVLYSFARDATHLPVFMTVQRAAMVFGLTVAMCGLSGIMALRKLRSADPAEVF